MNYWLDILNPSGECIRRITEMPLLDVYYSGPDEPARVSGLITSDLAELAPGYGVRVNMGGEPVAEARVVSLSPIWGDARRLVIDNYVRFHEVVAFEAVGQAGRGDCELWQRFNNYEVSALIKEILQSAPGRIHYGVAHNAFPDGARREYYKFVARTSDVTALETGGIESGTWVGPWRIDASSAYAKDGNTIAGLIVDRIAWPDFRLMMTDAEEVTLNARAIARHPEVADWTAARYEASRYKALAEAAREELQSYIDTWGIQFIELNVHTNAAGDFDGRMDEDGRYVGLSYGAGYCFGAALVEKGFCGVQLHDEGAYLPPEWELKDYLSYTGETKDTIACSGVALGAFEVRGSVLEAIATLCYAGGGLTFSVDLDGCVTIQKTEESTRLIEFDPARHAVVLGSTETGLVNSLTVTGHPMAPPFSVNSTRVESVVSYGESKAEIEHFDYSCGDDAALLAEGLLDDLAYPEPTGRIAFFDGNDDLRVGDGIVIYGNNLHRIDTPTTGEWNGSFEGKLGGRVRAIQHQIAGDTASTIAFLGSPLRSVRDPLRYLVKSRESAAEVDALKLDTEKAGLESGWHLD